MIDSLYSDRMSFGPCNSDAGDSRDEGSHTVKSVNYRPRPSWTVPRSNTWSDSSSAPDDMKWEMSMEEFKRQVQNHFTVALSWNEVHALHKIYGDPNSRTIDFIKFAAALGKSPGHGHGLDKTRHTYNFLPKDSKEHDLRSVEKKIVQKLEDRCKVAGNYQYQWARRMLCDSTSTTVGGLDRGKLKLRLSGLLGVELSDTEIDVLFHRHANPATGLVNMQSFATRLLAPERNSGWFMLDNQFREPVVISRISPSARYRCRPGVETYNPMNNAFPTSLKSFKWNIQKLVSKIKIKLNEQAQGIAGYQFLAGCNLFRREVPNRKSDRISAEDFRRVVEYRFGMKLDQDEILALFNTLVSGTGDTIGIAEMVRALVRDDYTDSWFSTRESTDMFGFTKAAPDKVVLQAKTRSVGGSWNLKLIEEKIQEKIHERVGGKGVFEVQAAYALFLDGRNTGLNKKSFKTQMHDKFAVVLSDKDVDDVFAKYDPKGTGSLDVHDFVLRIISPDERPDPWFRDRTTYEFHVLNRAPMKKDPMKAECWENAKWTYEQLETALRDKLMSKSSQDGGSFAYKSAVKLLRSANPDHLDSSHFDREALKFAVFRRFDVVMDDHLLDEVFARLDPEGTGKVSAHQLVKRLLPPRQDGSHHLVPKTEGQRKATRALLEKIFGMTGKRREMISLSGSGVEDPQPQSLLKETANGDKTGQDRIKNGFAKNEKKNDSSVSIVKMTAIEPDQNGRKSTANVVSRLASSVRSNGDAASTETVPNKKIQSATPSSRSRICNETRRRGWNLGANVNGSNRHDDNQQVARETLHERFQVREGIQPTSSTKKGWRKGVEAPREKECEEGFDQLEINSRRRADSFRPELPISNVVNMPSKQRRSREVTHPSAKIKHPPQAVPERSVSAARHPQEQVQAHNIRQHRPAYPRCRVIKERPQSARSSMQGQSKDEATLIAKCRALSAARRGEAVQRRVEVEEMPNRLRSLEHARMQGGFSSTQVGMPTRSDSQPQVPGASTEDHQRLYKPRKTKIENDHQLVGDEGDPAAYSGQDDSKRKSTEVRAASETVDNNVPATSRSAVATRRTPTCARPRPRSTSTSRRNYLDTDPVSGTTMPGCGHGGDGLAVTKIDPRGTRRDQGECSLRGPAHRSTHPFSANAAVGGSVEKCYRNKLESAYAVQMRAMERLYRRKKDAPSPERPASGECQGVGIGHFLSRHSGLDQFVLLRGGGGGRDRSIPTEVSRFGDGVPYFGP